jgi:hypothetical protein
MQQVVFLSLAVLLSGLVFTSLPEAATIVWGTVDSGLAVDSRGEPLWGTMEFALEPDLSLGALVQLWKAVGEIDDPTGKVDAYLDLNWHTDDVLLGESHIGFGAFHPSGSWAQTGDYAVNEYDTLYVRAYNVSKPDFASTPIAERELTIRNRGGEIVFDTVPPFGPTTCVFPDLQTRPIPEPSVLLILIPALTAWVINRKRSP